MIFLKYIYVYIYLTLILFGFLQTENLKIFKEVFTSKRRSKHTNTSKGFWNSFEHYTPKTNKQTTTTTEFSLKKLFQWNGLVYNANQKIEISGQP